MLAKSRRDVIICCLLLVPRRTVLCCYNGFVVRDNLFTRNLWPSLKGDRDLSCSKNGAWYLGSAGERKDIDIPNNINAADTTNADQVYTGKTLGLDLTGAGVTVGTWEAGGTVRASHDELTGRVTVVDKQRCQERLRRPQER